MNKRIKTVTWIRAVEAFLEILARIIGLALVYVIFEAIGKQLVNDFSEDVLLSIVILPSIFVLKDILNVIDPFTVKVIQSDRYIEVTRGWLTQKIDKLLLNNVDNLELTRTCLGRRYKYRTISLYSTGGYLEIPFVKDDEAELLTKEVEDLLASKL